MPEPAHVSDSTLHKVQIKRIEDRYIIIIDDETVFLAQAF